MNSGPNHVVSEVHGSVTSLTVPPSARLGEPESQRRQSGLGAFPHLPRHQEYSRMFKTCSRHVVDVLFLRCAGLQRDPRPTRIESSDVLLGWKEPGVYAWAICLVGGDQV